MNRIKKYMRQCGYKLESDFECLPHNEIEAIQVDSDNAILRTYYITIGWVYTRFNRDGSKVTTDIYTDFYHDEIY